MNAGIDPDAVTAWLTDRVGKVEPPLLASVIAGGKSNLTYRITDQADRQWVLRRPPLHGVIPKAHDMGREHQIISSLVDTRVPVPRTIGYEPDPSLIGASFYVMEFVEGLVLRDPEDASRTLDESARSAVGESMVDALLALHDVAPESVGLGDLGRKEKYLARQLRAWGRQLGEDDEAVDNDVQLLRDVRDRLGHSIPHQQQTSIVHGDYRLDNTIVSGEGRVKAVLDWELCTLGDPVADVATLAVYWGDPDDDYFPLETATTAPGFPRRMDLVDAYTRRSPLDLSRFAYYLAFATWRLAVIIQGVLNRYDSGAYGEASGEDWENLRQAIPRLGESALEHLRDGR